MKAGHIILAFSILSAAPMIGRGQQLDLTTAQKQFDKYCAKCHGPGGGGDGYLRPLLSQKPKDFTNCAEMAKESDDVLFNVIKNGGGALRGQKSDMPAMRRSLSDEEIRALLARVRQFCSPEGGLSVARDQNSAPAVQSP
jgi:mono/diheme cytochrome c family protein